MNSRTHLGLTAAHARPGLPINYYIKIDGRDVYTGGFVTKAVKTGDDEITITLEHQKTGELHTNVLHANETIGLHKATMAHANPHLFKTMLQMATTTMAISNGRAYFFQAEIGAELTQESSFEPGATPQTIVF